MDRNQYGFFGSIAMAVAVVIFALIIAFSAGNVTDAFRGYVKERAVDNCMRAASLTDETNKGVKASFPDKNWFEICMKEKGYR